LAATGSVVNGIGGALATSEAQDASRRSAGQDRHALSGAGGIGKGGGVDPWAYHKAIKAARAKRDKVVDLAPPEIIDAAEEARKAAAAEKIRLERRARLETEMRQDAAKEEQRRLIAEAKRARQEIEDRQAEAKRLTDALDPASVAKEQRRQRQVHANHQHAQAVHGAALELAGQFIRHLSTTPRKR
jgi:hypothetical protein